MGRGELVHGNIGKNAEVYKNARNLSKKLISPKRDI
jgi:hypothetical protein